MFFLSDISSFLLEKIGAGGYWGIFLLMGVESSFFPFPSEVVLIPAGYLVQQKELNLAGVIISGTLGSLFGALINYYLALTLGRVFLLKYGKYFFVSDKTFFSAEKFFLRHGQISTFLARLIPGVRQYISIPAGLSKLDLKLFCLWTSLGAGIWVSVLTFLGYLLGDNQDLIKENLGRATLFSLLFVVFGLVIYWLFFVRKKQKTKNIEK